MRTFMNENKQWQRETRIIKFKHIKRLQVRQFDPCELHTLQSVNNVFELLTKEFIHLVGLSILNV